jgi:hypothetical protein
MAGIHEIRWTGPLGTPLRMVMCISFLLVEELWRGRVSSFGCALNKGGHVVVQDILQALYHSRLVKCSASSPALTGAKPMDATARAVRP